MLGGIRPREVRMQINVTTFAGRRQHYIHRTLESLFASDWKDSNRVVNLIMGSGDESHVQEYVANPAVRIVPWDVETDPNMRWNCTLNKIRALHYGDDDQTVICEDDVVFHPDWCATLSAAAAEMGDEEYVLSLFAPREDLDKARFVKGKSLVKQYPRFVLQGAQALFYPSKKVRNQVADYLQLRLRGGSGDELIGRFARAYAALYATKEPLVGNIGWISCFHR
jgi:hypothetical protein